MLARPWRLSESCSSLVKTEIRNTSDGHMLEVRVTHQGLEERGFCSSMHLVTTKANQLTKALQRRLGIV